MVAIASVADAHPVTLETDDIPDLQLTPAPTIDVSVDGHQAIGDDLFDVSAGVEKARELEELAEADIVPADGNSSSLPHDIGRRPARPARSPSETA
jgi:hypothetical protein